MARQFSKSESTYSSPEGFWYLPGDTSKRIVVTAPRVKLFNVPEEEHGIPPDINLEAVQPPNSPTWTVPKKRNSRKKKGRNFYFYDTTEEDICFSTGGEVTTKNSFSVLDDIFYPEKRESPIGSSKKEDTYYSEVVDRMNNYFVQGEENKYNVVKYLVSMYSNKYNLCSGYFPDFIPLDNIMFEDLYSDNNIPRYYPYRFNGKYLKQISNSESKYNNEYFFKMKTAYDISKHFWGKPSPSSGIGTKGSGIGTQGEQLSGRKSNLNINSINIDDSNNSNNYNNNNDISIKTPNPVYPNSPYTPNHEDTSGVKGRLPKQGQKYTFNTQDCTHGGGGWR